MRVVLLPEPEDDLQSKCEDWLTWEHIPFIHIPNAAFKCMYRNNSVSLKQKKDIAEYLGGWHDLIIFQKGLPPMLGNHNLMVELKRKKGGRVRQNQKKRHKKVNTHVIRTLEDFQTLVKAWLKEVDNFNKYLTI